jgi:hypothetical protein
VTNEQVARSVARLIRGQFAVPQTATLPLPTTDTTVVDLSPLQVSLIRHRTEVDRWECVLAPTLPDAIFAYHEAQRTDRDGVVYGDAVALVHAKTVPGAMAPPEMRAALTDAARSKVDDWANVEWLTFVTLYLDGPNGLVGPLVMTPTAIAADGSLLAYGIIVPDEERAPEEAIDSCFLVYCAGVNFLNCVNVDYVEPKRGRAETRRMMRYGIAVHELVVRSRQEVAVGDGSTGTGTPLTSVRGHFSHYGEQYGRKKLFGRYEGRFWVPQHARGAAEYGVVKKNYRLEPEHDA